jgi:hypothetical protein
MYSYLIPELEQLNQEIDVLNKEFVKQGKSKKMPFEDYMSMVAMMNKLGQRKSIIMFASEKAILESEDEENFELID